MDRAVRLGELVVREEQLLERTYEEARPALELASHIPEARSWLHKCLHSCKGTEQVYSWLQSYVSTPAFLERLTSKSTVPEDQQCSSAAEVHQVLQPGWLNIVEAGQTEELLAEEELPAGAVEEDEDYVAPEPLDTGYVFVEKSDVIEAMGCFIAAYLANLPEAKSIPPKQLQRMLQDTFKQLRRGRIRKLWDWGRFLYRGAAITYSVFTVYENPWLVRAVMLALYTSSRILVGAVVA